jgi:methylenetetrahydrofolate reductase (NADPH)
VTGTLAEKIEAGRFVVTTELPPPKGTDLTELFVKADMLRGLVDAVNLTESPRARMAVEPKAVGKLLIERGIEPIVQMTARDRNRIALQADMLGAALLGIHNLLFMTGDSPEGGDHPDAKAVFDLNTSQMLEAASTLNRGMDMSGAALKGSPHFFLGATANPGAKDLGFETENTRRKIASGAQFLQTQALYDADALRRFVDAVMPDGVALLAGIIPPKSAKMAAWLNANVPGVSVPDAIIDELSAVAGTDKELPTAIEISARIIREIRPLCAGVHLMTLGWEEHIPRILEEAGIREQ